MKEVVKHDTGVNRWRQMKYRETYHYNWMRTIVNFTLPITVAKNDFSQYFIWVYVIMLSSFDFHTVFLPIVFKFFLLLLTDHRSILPGMLHSLATSRDLPMWIHSAKIYCWEGNVFHRSCWSCVTLQKRFRDSMGCKGEGEGKGKIKEHKNMERKPAHWFVVELHNSKFTNWKTNFTF